MRSADNLLAEFEQELQTTRHKLTWKPHEKSMSAGQHHRGQFGVYLRLVGAKVPHSYGPSGDETPDFLQG